MCAADEGWFVPTIEQRKQWIDPSYKKFVYETDEEFTYTCIRCLVKSVL